MIRPIASATVYLCVAPIDLRKQAASLALLVEQSLKRDGVVRVQQCEARSDTDFILGAQWPGLVVKAFGTTTLHLAAGGRCRHGIDGRRNPQPAARWVRCVGTGASRVALEESRIKSLKVP